MVRTLFRAGVVAGVDGEGTCGATMEAEMAGVPCNLEEIDALAPAEDFLNARAAVVAAAVAAMTFLPLSLVSRSSTPESGA